METFMLMKSTQRLQLISRVESERTPEASVSYITMWEFIAGFSVNRRHSSPNTPCIILNTECDRNNSHILKVNKNQKKRDTQKILLFIKSTYDVQ